MIRSIWNFLAGLKLTLWLMGFITVILFIGGSYCLYDYAFFNTMNGVPVQKWFMEHGITHLHLTWWLPALFLGFFFLGINLGACAVDRIIQLLPKRSQMGFGAFFTVLTPSLVHLAFLMVLGGHFITFTMGYQQRIPVAIGESAALPDGGTIKFLNIESVMYPDNTILKGRKAQMTLTAEIDGAPARLSFAEYISRGFFALHLDMNMREGKAARVAPKMNPDETCNQSDLYKKKTEKKAETKSEAGGPALLLQVTYDPGLGIIIVGLALVIALMGWFFIRTYARRNGRAV
jgi:hypothetical protein